MARPFRRKEKWQREPQPTTFPVTGFLKAPYGPLRASIDYKVSGQGYDFYVVSDVNVPKDLVFFSRPEQKTYEDFIS